MQFLHDPTLQLKRVSKSVGEFTRIRQRLNELSLKKKKKAQVPQVLTRISKRQTGHGSTNQSQSQAQSQAPQPQLQVPQEVRTQARTGAMISFSYFTIEDTLRMYLQDPEVHFEPFLFCSILFNDLLLFSSLKLALSSPNQSKSLKISWILHFSMLPKRWLH